MPIDYVQGPGPTDVDKANRADVGDITLGKTQDWVITKVWAMVANVGTKAQSKPCVGYISLESEDCSIAPFHFPFAPTPSHLGATPHSSRDKAYKFNVNCPAPKGAVISCYATLGVAAPQGAPEVTVCIEYGPASGGPQLHMDVLEPSGALGTADNATTTMSSLTIKNAREIILFWAVAAVATLVADESVIVGMKITCAQFEDSSSLKFPLEPCEEGDATTSGTDLHVTFVEETRRLKNAPTEAVIVPTTTQYDANNAAPECYVGVAYT